MSARSRPVGGRSRSWAAGWTLPGPAAHIVDSRGPSPSHGAIVSELAPGVSATQGTFPRRNRIISALAAATIVVEAPARSGALITARHALEQGRALLVAPGRPLDPAVAGCLALLRETPARPLVGLDEMLVDLGLDVAPGWPHRRAAAGSPPRPRWRSSGHRSEPSLRSCVAARDSVDALVRASGQPPGVVAARSTLLQLRGWARELGPCSCRRDRCSTTAPARLLARAGAE